LFLGRTYPLWEGLAKSPELPDTALPSISSCQTQKQLVIAQQGHETDRQPKTADRFTTTISQLENKSVDVRLGGIYALQRIHAGRRLRG
jgi:hypothetical protein